MINWNQSNWYDMMKNEIFNEKHSLSALYYCLSHGREVDMEYKGNIVGIYTYKDNKEEGYVFVSGYYQIEEKYKSVDDLFENAKIKGTALIDLWEEIEVKILF